MGASAKRPGQGSLASKKLPVTGEHRTVLGLGVPVASSRLDLNDEDTRQYVPEAMPGVSLSALLARCAYPSDPGAVESTSPMPPRIAVEPPQPTTQPESVAPADMIAPVVSPSGIRPRDASFHTVPNFPEDSYPDIEVKAESNLHQVAPDRITDALTSNPSVDVIKPHAGWSSRPPDAFPAVKPRAPRSRGPSWLARLVFVAIALAVTLLLATEVAVATHRPWLDPRPLLTKGVRLAKEKIPWDRIPRIHRP